MSHTVLTVYTSIYTYYEAYIYDKRRILLFLVEDYCVSTYNEAETRLAIKI